MKRIIIGLFSGWLLGSFSPVRGQVMPNSATILSTVTKIAEQVWHTFPDQRPLPAIQVVHRGDQPVMARFRPRPLPTLYINETLYNLCTTFGTDSLTALALVLGHELTHFHANHKDWLDIAQDQQAGKPMHISPAKADELVTLEALADREATLHAYLAGYNGFQLLKPLYESLYRTYKLPETMPGYPDKSARIALSLTQVASARENAMLIDAATFLFVIGQFDLAEPCLTSVVQQWPLVGMQSNLAALYLQKALRLTDCREMPFILPVAWDVGNRLLTLRGQQEENQRAYLLAQAGTYASLSHRNDPTHTSATLNLAIVNLLTGNPGTAEDLMNLFIGQGPRPEAYLIRGIARLQRSHDRSAAEADMSRITGSANETFNRAAMAAWPDCPARPGVLSTRSGADPEPGLGTYRLPLPPWQVYPVRAEIDGPQYLTLMGLAEPSDEVDALRLQDGQASWYDVVKTTSPVWPTALGLRTGQPEADILTRYGPPDTNLALSADSRVYIYQGAGLLIFTRSGTISQLLVYRHTP